MVAVTAAGWSAARRLAADWPDVRLYEGPVAGALPRAFAECDGVVAFLATGAAVRLVAPLLGGKRTDPGVVCVDESRRYAVALLGGHSGGANELARRVGRVLGCEPVVTTASDATGTPAIDELAAIMDWVVEPGGDVSAVGVAILSGERVTLVSERVWPLPALPENVEPGGAVEPEVPAIVVSDTIRTRDNRPWRGSDSGSSSAFSQRSPVVVLRPRSLVVGVGASRGVSATEVLELVDGALDEFGLSPLSVRHLASVDVKSDEGGLRAAAERRGWPIVFHRAQALREIETPNPSALVDREVGTPSVAEAAALIGEPTGITRAAGAPGAELLVEKRRSAMATVAVARHPPRGRLTLVGLGPGARDLLSPRAEAELRRASVVVGLDQYVAGIQDLLRPGTRVLASGLGAEQARARTAVEEARRGHAVALVGSGDAGVYALASPALLLAGTEPAGEPPGIERPEIEPPEIEPPEIEIAGVPGITAALAASSLLGAPLGHDHVAISLSDLHTPWEVIERRVRAAAEGDFVVCFYNPRSRARDWQLGKALATLAEHRPAATPVGLVRQASRPDEQVTITTLGQLGEEQMGGLQTGSPGGTYVDMYTVVVVGSTTTVRAGACGQHMVTPRGYRWTP